MYSIQDVSKKTGLSAHTLRYYEKEGLLPHVNRTPGGFRQYTDEDMEAIAALDKKQSSFFSHYDPGMVEWFAKMVEERKHQHDSSKEKKNW